MTHSPAKPLSELSDTELMAELARRRTKTDGDVTALEDAAEAVKLEVGILVVRDGIEARCIREDGAPTRCPKCGGKARVEQKRTRTVRTRSGEQTYLRNCYRCSACRHGFAPVDNELGISPRGTLTPEVETRILDFGVNDSFEEAARRFSMHYSWDISENLVRRVVDRVADVLESLPEPVLQAALQKPSVKPAKLITIGIDGSMLSTREGWQETKLGVVIRDEHHLEGTPTTRGLITQARYVAASKLSELKPRLLAAAQAAGVDTAEHVVVVGDGAAWIRLLAEELFVMAIVVLDWPHVVEHLMACGKALLGEGSDLLQTWKRTTTTLVWNGKLDLLLAELAAVRDDSIEAVDALMGYLTNHRESMNYPRFRELGLPTGSGVAESAHKHVLQVRMKRAGQHWSPPRCNRMARLRAAYRTGGPTFASRIDTARLALIGF